MKTTVLHGQLFSFDTIDSVIRTEGSEYCQRRLTVFSRWHHSKARMPSYVYPTSEPKASKKADLLHELL